MRITVLIISNSYPNPYKSYAGKHVERHNILLQEAGLNIIVASPGDSRQGWFFSSLKYLLLLFKVFHHVLFSSFDLIHAHWELPSGLIGLFAATIRHKPFVLTSHGAFTNNYDDRPIWQQQLIRFVWKKANKIIAVGKVQQKKIAEIVEYPLSMIEVISMGVWLPEQSLPDLIAQPALKLQKPAPIIGFVGNLRKNKGADLLIYAVRELLNRGITVRVYIAGIGPESDNLVQLIETCSLKDIIQMVGAIPPDAMFDWLMNLDVCVVPSRQEAFGLVAVEAMAVGTAVVGANVGGLAQTIHHRKSGLLFEVDDYKGLADCLEEMVKDEAFRQELSRAGQKTVAHYDMKKQVKMVYDVYMYLLTEIK